MNSCFELIVLILSHSGAHVQDIMLIHVDTDDECVHRNAYHPNQRHAHPCVINIQRLLNGKLYHRE